VPTRGSSLYANRAATFLYVAPVGPRHPELAGKGLERDALGEPRRVDHPPERKWCPRELFEVLPRIDRSLGRLLLGCDGIHPPAQYRCLLTSSTRTNWAAVLATTLVRARIVEDFETGKGLKFLVVSGQRPRSIAGALTADPLRSGSELMTESVLLRQQLIVAARKVKRPAFRRHERALITPEVSADDDARASRFAGYRRTHQADGRGESTLRRRTHSRRAAEAPNSGREAHGAAVYE
jgi:hypothetical protein